MNNFLKFSLLPVLAVVTFHSNAHADKKRYIECPPVSKVIITEDDAHMLLTSRYADKFSGYAAKDTLAALESLKIIKIDPRAYRVVCHYNTTEKKQVTLVLEKTFDECMQKDKHSAVCSD